MNSSHTTQDRHGYSIKFSPFDANQLLLASSQLYGLAGGGTLFLLQLIDAVDAEVPSDVESATVKSGGGSSKVITEVCRMEWSDGLFDVVWCPHAENVAASASGDGTLQIWSDMGKNSFATDGQQQQQQQPQPAACLKEHKNEVYSIDWGEQWNHNCLLSASWDGLIKLWDCNRQHSLATFAGHSDFVYCAKFSPLIANLFGSVSTDGYLNLWNCFDFSGKPLMSIQAAENNSELLALDWSQFDRNVLVTGGSDGMVRGWDLRMLKTHIFELYSGEFAVRRLAFSPTHASLLASANYDFTTRIWDLSHSLKTLEVNEYHSEFVCGLDWNANCPYQLADCGWDAVVNVYTPHSLLDLPLI